MDIPPDHAEAVIKFMHWGKLPPPKEPANPAAFFRDVRRRAAHILRVGEVQEGQHGEGEVDSGDGRELKELYRRWRGTAREASIPLQTFSENRLDEDTW